MVRGGGSDVEMSIGDIIDRASIIDIRARKLKCKEFLYDYTKKTLKEWAIFNRELELIVRAYQPIPINDLFKKMLRINRRIWNLEASIRQGKLDDNIMEVGIRAIKIRELNKKRVDFKNYINKITDTGFQDIKINHLSGENTNGKQKGK